LLTGRSKVGGILRQHRKGRKHDCHEIAALGRLTCQDGDSAGLLQLGLLPRGDGAVIKGVDDHNPGHHQQRHADRHGCVTPLAALGLFDPRLLHPGKHWMG
jgi:hypothetical protein